MVESWSLARGHDGSGRFSLPARSAAASAALMIDAWGACCDPPDAERTDEHDEAVEQVTAWNRDL